MKCVRERIPVWDEYRMTPGGKPNSGTVKPKRGAFPTPKEEIERAPRYIPGKDEEDNRQGTGSPAREKNKERDHKPKDRE